MVVRGCEMGRKQHHLGILVVLNFCFSYACCMTSPYGASMHIYFAGIDAPGDIKVAYRDSKQCA